MTQSCFKISYSISTLPDNTRIYANMYSRGSGSASPGIIIRLIRTTVIGQITT